MKQSPNHIKSIFIVMAIAFFVVFFIIVSQTSALAVQPMVAAGQFHTVGLKSDGTLVTVGSNEFGQLNVGSWTGIIQVAAGERHTVGLKSDGTVVAAGYNLDGQLNVGSWTNIAQVAAGERHTVGLKSDGTVVSTAGFYNVSFWTNIIQVAAGGSHIVGVKSGGNKVLGAGSNSWGQLNFGTWTGIVQVDASTNYTVGLRSGGNVRGAGSNGYGQLNFGSWTNIAQVAAGVSHTVGLKYDGTVVTVGNNSHGQRNVGSWTDIVQVAAGNKHTVGLKYDGTVVAVGNNDFGQCNLFDWDLQPDFVDVPSGHWAEAAIYKIYNAGITKGCSLNPLLYCPDKTVSKAAMAVFLLRSLHGGDYSPPPATGIFTDVDINQWYAPWVEQLYKEGITKGCSADPLMYCPDRDVSKASMAIFLLRSKYGVGYTPPAATGIFTDVPLSHWGADWIEKLYIDGITQGCSADPLMYCPDRAVSRAAMALFLVRTFGF